MVRVEPRWLCEPYLKPHAKTPYRPERLAAVGSAPATNTGVFPCCLPVYAVSVQLSEKASEDVLNGRPSRSRGQALPAALVPLIENDASNAGMKTVHKP